MFLKPNKDKKYSFEFIFDEKIFHYFCLFIIFSFLWTLYSIKLLDISQNEASIIGIGIFIISLSDLIINGFKKVIIGKLIYTLGLGIIIIIPYVKLDLIEILNLDSIKITLIGLFMVFYTSMVNKINNIFEEKKMETSVKILNIFENQTDLIKEQAELTNEYIDILNYFKESAVNTNNEEDLLKIDNALKLMSKHKDNINRLVDYNKQESDKIIN